MNDEVLENLNGEIWKKIEEFEDYMISNYGRVKSLKWGKENILNPVKDKDGYLIIGLRKNNKKHRIRVHRLVAEHFIEKIDGKDIVNHKDGNKHNNVSENLEWVTQYENMIHAIDSGLMDFKGENNPFYGKKHSEKSIQKRTETFKENYKKENHPLFGKHHSDETKEKISNSLKGKMTGENNSFYGKHHSEESKEKNRLAHLGTKITEETKKKMSESNRGKNSSLTEKDVIEIKIILRDKKMTQQEIADKYGVNRSAIVHIKNGRTWKYVKID